MKNKDYLMLFFSILFLLFVILIFVNAVQIEQPKEELPEPNRTSITFILGEDEDRKNRFYENATSYFRYNPEAKTDEMIDHARSLNEVIDILNQSFAKNAETYDDIHLVVHSNPWAGISIPLERGGERLTDTSLKEAMVSGKVRGLNDRAIDTLTTLHIHACGLGNNKELIGTLKTTFNHPKMKVSEGYVNFAAKNGLFKKSEMDVYYAFFPTAYRPADLHLVRQLKKRYPTTDMNWLLSLKNSSYSYNIPVEWEINYPEYDVPSLDNDLDKMEWLMNQDQLLDIIEKTGIPFDYFRWIVKRKGDSIVVYGKVTVMCILKSVNV